MMTERLLSDRQINLMREANAKLKEAFPTDNLGVSFNLSAKHTAMNYNIKASGIDKPSPGKQKGAK